MKSKYAILASTLGLALISGANAQNVIRLVGATALRGSVNSQIKALIPNATIAYSADTATTLDNATMANFTGTYNGQPTLVQISWSTSPAGIQAVAQQTDVTFLAASNTGTTGAGTQVSSGAATEVNHADATLSEVSQISTTFTTPHLTDNRLCVIPYVWVVNDGAPANFINVTPGLALSLYGSQFMPLSLFTGAASDRLSGAQVYGLGCNPACGNRISMDCEAGLGAFATVFQSIVTLSGDVISNPQYFPGNDVFGDGDNGYDSGAKLAAVLAAKSGDTNVYLGYLSLSDFTNIAAPGGARALTWKGVACNPTTIQEGLYSFWGYGHLLYRSTLPSDATKIPFVNALKTNLVASPDASAIKLADMHASRSTDGAPIGN